MTKPNLAAAAEPIDSRGHPQRTGDELAARARDAEQRLRLYEAALSNTPDHVYVFDLQHRFTYANETLLKVWGRTWEEAIGKTCLEVGYEPWHAAMHDREIDHVIATGEPIKGEVPFSGTFGRRLYEYIFVPVVSDSGAVEAVAGTTRDVTDRRLAEERFRQFMENSPATAFIKDQRGRYLFVNGRVERAFERPAADWIGRTDRDLFSLAEAEQYQVNDRCALAAGGTTRVEETVGAGDQARHFISFKFPLEVEDGPPLLAGMSLEITELKRAEQLARAQTGRLQAQFERFESLVTATSQIVWVSGPDGSLVEPSPSWESFTGTSFEQSAGWQWLEAVHPDDRQWKADAWTRSLEQRTAYAAECRIRRHDGEYRWMAVRAVPVLERDGTVREWVGTNVDITDARAADEALRLQTARSNRLLESNVIGVIFSDEERILDANDAFLNMLGYTRAELQRGEISWRLMTPPEHLPADERALQEMHRRGACTPFQKEYIRKDGQRVPILLGAAVVDARKPEYVCFVQDMTRIKQIENELRAADRRKDEFLATLAHELRNPLAPIRNAVQILRAKGPAAPELIWGRDVIDRQVSQMARLLDDLLDVSRITSNKLQLRKSRVLLAAVVDSALEASRPLIEQMGHCLTVSLPSHPVPLDADLTRLAQVFANLLNNAAKYTDPGGSIWLTADVQDDEVVVAIRDTGLGIGEDDLRHVFEMFSQAGPAESRAQGGLGIGLSLVRGLVELHGGRVDARSDGPGTGSEFIVRLPAIREAVQRTAPEPSGAAALKSSLRVLIVDDNKDGADSLAMMLALTGNDTRTAYDGAEAVAAAAAFHPQVILLDIGLPTLSGYEVCRRIREQPWGARVVIIAQTGWGQEQDRERTRASGFDHHLVKPLDMSVLNRVLASVQPADTQAGPELRVE